MGSFNGRLDSTVAIIIPVLFLALGVQRHLYQDLLQAYYNAARDLRQRARPGTRMVPPLLITVAAGAITTFILVYGTVGEVDAILALSHRHPVGSATPVVAAVGLAIAVAAGGLGAAARLPQRDAAAQPGGPAAAGVPGAPRRRPGLRRGFLLGHARGGDRPDGQRAQHVLGG